MRPVRRFLRRLAWWATTRRDEDRLRAEIEEHIALQTADNIRAGMAPAEARRQAALKFGGVEAMKERYREQRGLPSLERLIQDTRYALRRLRLAPAFTASTVMTLALGIGATTSIFTLVYAVLLRSLPVSKPDQLYRLGKKSRCCYFGGYAEENEFSLVSYELYQRFRDHKHGFAELAAFSASQYGLAVRRTGRAETAQPYPGEFVSGNYFAMFGMGAYAGRTLTAQDDRPGAPPVAVMSYRLWQQRYGSDPSVVGSVFDLNGKPFTVVGIAPPEFFGDALRRTPPDFFVPLNTEPLFEGDLYTPDNHWLDLIGRIRSGVAPATAEAEMRVVLKQWLRLHWSDMTANERAVFPRQTLYLMPGGGGITSMREFYEGWLRILMAVTGFVLLIVCANVANLTIVRGMERRRETSLSMALGAQSSRVVRQALTESILLSLCGGAAGVAIAYAGTQLVLRLAFPAMPGRAGVPISASPSTPVLLFAFGVSLIAGIVFGAAPAWIATSVDPIEALRGTGRGTTRSNSLVRKMLVVFQAALSLVLLSASGLLLEALRNLENQRFGFEQERRIVASIEPRLAGYRGDQLTPLFQRLQDTLARIPGIAGVALCTYSPLGGNNWGAGIRVDGHPEPGPKDENGASWDRVTPGYLGVTGNRILRGRDISEQDTATSRHVAVINEAFARKFFRGEDPMGKHFGQHGIGTEREYEVAGIAEHARYLNVRYDKPVEAFFFLPEPQHDIVNGKDANPGSHFLRDIVIVTQPGANLSFGQVRQAIASVDPTLPIATVRTMSEQVSSQFTQQRLIARLTSFFGVLSLVLASIGLYGITAYNAERRTAEIGVRRALGASRGDVVRLVLRGAFVLILIGLGLGLPLTLAAARLLRTQLYGMGPYNFGVAAVSVVVLGLAALVASVVPALRASGISPAGALRAE
jgi:predicted permease